MTFLSENINQIEFEIYPDLAQQSWQQSQLQPTAKGQWNEYLNRMCLQSFLSWLQAESEQEVSSLFDESLLASFWSVVNGTAINWGDKRLVLIPNKSLDNSEYSIPQEWIDIPKLVGDYYLAVQINPDELSMRVWGYTTHQHIKTSANYNSIDRTYNLDAEEMIQDINVLWVVNQLNPDEQTRVFVANLAVVPNTQAENLLSRLVNSEIIQPRLELPFYLWGELVSNDDWRQRLYQLRQGELETNLIPAKVVVNLSGWVQNSFAESWQAIDSLLNKSGDLGFSFRSNVETDETTIRRGKIINLGNSEVFLILALDIETDGRIGIRIQLRSQNQEEYLPAQTNLKLVSASGQVIQSIQSRNQDNIIQLKRFKSPAGTEFRIQIEVDNFVVNEDFVI